MKKIVIMVFALFSMNSNAWWIDTHAAFTEVALKDLTPKTQNEINLLLHYPITEPGSAELSNESSDILNGSWADRIKHVKWQYPNARTYYKALHFMDIIGTVDEKIDVSQSRNRINNFLLRNAKKKMNILYGIQSMVKTIKSRDTSIRDRAIALRLLFSLIGDIHDPMHLLDIYIDNKSTTGQNKINLEPVITLTSFAGTSQKITILHELWDASGGYVKDNGAQHIVQKSAYRRYLHLLAKEMIAKQENNSEMMMRVSDPDLVHWAADSHLLGLEATRSQHIHYSMGSNGYVTGQINHPDAYVDFVQKICQQQLYLAGKHTALLLNALFDPEHASKPYVAYLQKIKENPSVQTLKEMPPFR